MVAAWDWGSVPAWVGLIGALVAGASYLAGRHEQRRALAAKVYVMPVSGLYKLDLLDPIPNRLELGVQVVNDSPGPIFDIHVIVWNHGGRRRIVWQLWPYYERVTRGHVTDAVVTAMWPESRSKEFAMVGRIGRMPIGMRRDSFAISISFRDANGRRWVRWPDGRMSTERLSRGSRPRSHEVDPAQIADLQRTLPPIANMRVSEQWWAVTRDLMSRQEFLDGAGDWGEMGDAERFATEAEARAAIPTGVVAYVTIIEQRVLLDPPHAQPDNSFSRFDPGHGG